MDGIGPPLVRYLNRVATSADKGGKTVNLMHRVVPGDRIVSEVPIPDSDFGDGRSQRKAAGKIAQICFDFLAFGDIGIDRQDPVWISAFIPLQSPPAGNNDLFFGAR